jgi:hypothetical protein
MDILKTASDDGPTSTVHSDDDLDRTVDAFRATLRMMKEEGDL